jgi:hypothetical protein
MDLRNHSVAAARCVPSVDRHGRDVIVVVAKVTLEVSIHGEVWRAAEPAPVRVRDETVAGGWSSIRFPSDLADEKLGTDVLLVGTAHPPRREKVNEADATLRVARPAVGDGAPRLAIEKTVRVFGPRVFYSGALGVVPGPAAALAPTPLTYENAYGGTDASDPINLVTELRNPVGTGFARKRATLAGRPAPLLEDPAAPIAGRAPAPACFGAIASHWSPRTERVGTHDEVWRRERAPYRPLDFDPRHNNFAPDDLHVDEPLSGGELVQVTGVLSEGAWRFRLPSYALAFEGRVDAVRVDLPGHLDTVIVDADARRVELVWRTTLRVPKKPGFIDHVCVNETTAAPALRPRATSGQTRP